MIVVEDVYKYFGGFYVVDGVIMIIEWGLIIGLIGFNGVGKIIFFNVIVGVFELIFGCVIMDGEDIIGLLLYMLFYKGLLCIF